MVGEEAARSKTCAFFNHQREISTLVATIWYSYRCHGGENLSE